MQQPKSSAFCFPQLPIGYIGANSFVFNIKSAKSFVFNIKSVKSFIFNIQISFLIAYAGSRRERQQQSAPTEIAPVIYCISIYVSEISLKFSHFPVRNYEPLLFHADCGTCYRRGKRIGFTQESDKMQLTVWKKRT